MSIQLAIGFAGYVGTSASLISAAVLGFNALTAPAPETFRSTAAGKTISEKAASEYAARFAKPERIALSYEPFRYGPEINHAAGTLPVFAGERARREARSQRAPTRITIRKPRGSREVSRDPAPGANVAQHYIYRGQ